ncbi:hypothetical protein FCO27_18880 [Bacillus pumilus]|nr:hypothetical protein FCO27_18880 [Bacillus pumilus]
MRLNKMALIALTASALTACGTTANRSATPIKMVELPAMPAPPAALLMVPQRPEPPADGSARALLEHAAEFGGYVAEIEHQNAAWRLWATGGQK